MMIYFPIAGSSSDGATTTLTVRDLLTGSLIDLEQVSAGEPPSPEDLDLSLDRANEFLDNLKTETLSPYTITRTTWPLTSAATITIGSGGTVNVERPINPQAITGIGYVDTSTSPETEYLLGQPSTIDDYMGLVQKGLSSPFPTCFYYNPTYPLGTLVPWPLPTASGLLGVIYARTTVSTFSSINDSLSLPPGYRRYLRSRIALEMAAAFGVEPKQSVKDTARESTANVKRANMRVMEMATDWGGGGIYDIYSDEVR